MPPTRRPKRAGDAALDRLHTSLEAAENALKDLRNELSRDARDLVKELAVGLRDARRHLTRSRGRIAKQLGQADQGKGKSAAARSPQGSRASSPSAKGAKASGTTRATASQKKSAKPSGSSAAKPSPRKAASKKKS